MLDEENLHTIIADPIGNHVGGPWHDEFARAFDIRRGAR